MEVLSSRVLLRPTDLDAGIRFYRDTLGLAVFREYGVGESRGVVFFLGGGFLEVSGTAAPGDPGRLGIWLQVRDLAAAEADLEAGGVTIEQPGRLMPWGLKELWARDPDGVRLVFIEVPDEHPLRKRPD